MKKILLGSTCVFMLSIATAYAQLDVQLNLGQPGYVEPAPVYTSPYPTYYDPHHRNHDYQYWRDQHHRAAARPAARAPEHR